MNEFFAWMQTSVCAVSNKLIVACRWLRDIGIFLLLSFGVVSLMVGMVLFAYVRLNDTERSTHVAYIAEFTHSSQTTPARATFIDAYTGDKMTVTVDVSRFSSSSMSQEMTQRTSAWIAKKLDDAKGTCVVVIFTGALWEKQFTGLGDVAECPVRRK